MYADSVCTRKKLDIDSKKLELFSFDFEGSVYALQSGLYSKDGTWDRSRGISNLGNKQIEHLDMIEKDSNLYQIMNVLRVGRLRTSILSNSINEIDKFKTVERLVNLNQIKRECGLKN